ncbi:aminoglycoside phosphotransferase family protein [Sorangium sp. So ce291]|uniref:phosphotransferase family protein n=1 Tax=Sorangium sp. So ce291 TaxID=3133294 RepID=UPI003F647618
MDMSTVNIPKERLEDCIAVLLDAESLNVSRDDIVSIDKQAGGLFNFLLRVETTRGVFFYKQYLDNQSNEIYNVPKIPASERSNLACEVQRLASESITPLGMAAVPDILHFDRKRSAFLMQKAAGDCPLIDRLSAGQIPDVVVVQLPKVLACLHQSTYGRFSEDSIYGNREFRDFKLRLQYDDIAQRLDRNEADIVMDCRARYQSRSDCVTHGDINSRNILVDHRSVGVIDFEQSHLGTPAYDLAYILSEIFISAECFGKVGLGELISRFLDNYFEHFSAANRREVETEITKHLAVQAIYRFWGPSRASWTFYVNSDIQERIIRRCRNLLLEDGAVTELVR